VRVSVIGTTGDVDPFSYGGGVIYKAGDSVVWEWWDEPETDDPNERIMVYRRHLDGDVLATFPADMVKSAAAAVGVPVSELRSASKSKNPMDVQRALEAVVLTWGPIEVDQYPIELTLSQLKKRWNRRLDSFLRRRWRGAAKESGLKSDEQLAAIDPVYLTRTDRIRYAKALINWRKPNVPGMRDDRARRSAAVTIRDLAKKARARKKALKQKKG